MTPHINFVLTIADFRGFLQEKFGGNDIFL